MVHSNDEVADLDQRRICCECIGEEYLSSEISKSGEEAKCYYCERNEKTISIGELADYIDAAFDDHYRRTPIDPSGYEVQLQKEGHWERSGDPVEFVIQEAAMIEEAPAIDVREVLEHRTSDVELARMGEEGPYDEDANYEWKGPNDIEWQLRWQEFEHGIRTSSRFFSRSAQSSLDAVFQGIEGLKTAEDCPVIVQAGPERGISALFRARAFQSSQALEVALERPDLEIGPPPVRLAAAGRMNPQGISVFYGATSEMVAISEVRPPVGSKVICARFEIDVPLRLLDVEALRDVLVAGSIFDRGYIRHLEHARFLERLSSKIIQPVMPNDEPYDYLPTQAIAEYLSESPEPRLDGMIYPSAQAEDGRNVVLFHHSARVAEIDLPQGTKIDVGMGHFDAEDFDAYYSVWETVPSEKPTPKEKNPILEAIMDLHHADSPLDSAVYDDRNASLKIDPHSVAVHHVYAVLCKTNRHSVSRYRQTKTESEPF